MLDHFEAENDYIEPALDQLRMVVDVDSWTEKQLQELIHNCREVSHRNLAVSNPCFELWYILLCSNLTEDLKNNIAQAVAQERSELLKKHWNITVRDKSGLTDRNKTLEAVEKAESLDTAAPDAIPHLLTTRVYKLIEQLFRLS